MSVVGLSSVRAFGPGKVILLGEHGVVYGFPALAGALDQGVRAFGEPAPSTTLEVPFGLTPGQRAALEQAFARAAALCGEPPVSVSLESDLPPSMGLGSSGALSVAVARLLLGAGGRTPPRARVEQVALEMEKAFHGTPSGVDHTTSARGGLVLFRTGQVRAVTPKRPLGLVVVLSGARASTRVTVGALRERQARWPRRYRRLFETIGEVVKDGARAAETGDLEELGDAMNVNQGLLDALGLSSPSIERVVHELRGAGALGAKLTGAGGDGGAVIGLFPDPRAAARKLKRRGLQCFASVLGGTA